MSCSDGFHLIFMNLIAYWKRLIKMRNKHKNRPRFFIVSVASFSLVFSFPSLEAAIIMIRVMLRKNVRAWKLSFTTSNLFNMQRAEKKAKEWEGEAKIWVLNWQIKKPRNGVVNKVVWWTMSESNSNFSFFIHFFLHHPKDYLFESRKV